MELSCQVRGPWYQQQWDSSLCELRSTSAKFARGRGTSGGGVKEGRHQVLATLNVRFGWLEKKGVWLAATSIAGVGGEKAEEEVDIETEDVTNWVGT